MTLVRSIPLLVRWQFLRFGTLIPTVMIVQTLFAVLVIFGFSMLLPNLDSEAGTRLAAGAPTVILLTIGLVLIPQNISRGRQEGSLEHLRGLPIPRASFFVADALLWAGLMAPAIVASVLTAEFRFDVDLRLGPTFAIAGLLVVLTGLGIGYGLGTMLPPMLTEMMTNILIFVILLFSPVNIPMERLPSWLQQLHRPLPIDDAAFLVRATLLHDQAPVSWLAVSTVVVWSVAGFGFALFSLSRRH
jgi:ABC-2 type transport system permease protein